MKIIFIFLFLFFFTSVFAIPKEEKLAIKLIDKFSANEAKHRGLRQTAIGFKGNEKSIEGINLFFETDEVLTIERARQLMVETVTQISVLLNQNKQLRKYLDPYPLPYKNCGIAISTTCDKVVTRPHVRSVFNIWGKLHYSDDQRAIPEFGKFHVESFEEARSLLEKH